MFDSLFAFDDALLLRIVKDKRKLSKKMTGCFILISPNYELLNLIVFANLGVSLAEK